MDHPARNFVRPFPMLEGHETRRALEHTFRPIVSAQVYGFADSLSHRRIRRGPGVAWLIGKLLGDVSGL